MSKQVQVYVFVAVALFLVGCITIQTPAQSPPYSAPPQAAPQPVQPSSNAQPVKPASQVQAQTQSVPSTMLLSRGSPGRCLAVDRMGVVHKDCNRNDSSQQWQISSSEIRLGQSSSCLTVNGGDVQAHYYVTSCSGQANQRWNIINYGSWIQLASQFSSKCVDVRQWVPGSDAEIFQWHCKPIADDKELDNQLWIQSGVEDVANLYPVPTPPRGVYVTDIQSIETAPTGRNKCFTFRVTFSDMGGAQPFRWWVQIYRSGSPFGETPKLDQTLGAGIYDSDQQKPWCVGFDNNPFTAQVFWWRNEVEPNKVPFRDPLGRITSSYPFQPWH